ncbi:MAG: mRNA splicing protein prp18 [Pycnora praestabilis]|nr:MAG: mRNA splicing protein prp18 [Pycnora praestabilis]
MDFASLMSQQISKGRQGSPPESEQRNKYLKRAEVEAQREAAYAAEQEALQAAREEKASSKRKREEDEAARNRDRDEKRRKLAEESRRRREDEEEQKERARRKRLGLPTIVKEIAEDKDEMALADGEEDMPEEALLNRLRALAEPARLFGEGHKQRLRRYARLTFRALAPQAKQSTGPIPTTLEMVPEAEMKVQSAVPKDEGARRFLFRQLASYFTMVLTEWAEALAQRPESVQQSFQGKAAYNAMVQSRENMRPLFKKFERGELEDGILEPVIEIVKSAQERRYVDANDGYLRLSIGKAAWPIGVTMVGIHERSAREKLHESDKGQAHIMSDEITRKFLQSIKRCLSFAQTRWPPDDQLQLMG